MWLVGPVTIILQLSFFLNSSSAERGDYLLRKDLEWKPGKKLLNPMRKTEKENQGTNENILAL